MLSCCSIASRYTEAVAERGYENSETEPGAAHEGGSGRINRNLIRTSGHPALGPTAFRPISLGGHRLGGPREGAAALATAAVLPGSGAGPAGEERPGRHVCVSGRETEAQRERGLHRTRGF